MICNDCGKDVSRIRRHKYRCPGRKAPKPKMPKKRRGTGLDPGKIVIVGGTEEQRRIVERSLEKGELDG